MEKPCTGNDVLDINPVLYEETLVRDREDTSKLFRNHRSKLRWSDGDKIIDIGCGNGVFTNLFKRCIPVNFEQLVGCDGKEELISMANDKYADTRTSFIHLDIGEVLPDKWKGRFNRAISCNSLHLVANQRQAFQNIYDLLTEQGDCLLMFVCKSAMYEAYILIAEKRNWKPWIKGSVHLFSRYQNSNDPVRDVRQLIDGIGFKKVSVHCEEESKIYIGLDYFLKLQQDANPCNIPDGPLLSSFICDIKRVLLNNNLIPQFDNSNRINYIYSRIVISASK